VQTLPIIDVAPLFAEDASARHAVAQALGTACHDHGFFYATGHRISQALIDRMDRASCAFFALPEWEKNAIAMTKVGPAWRGY
jgi:isopenicillin N synthase-like dioxygenase